MINKMYFPFSIFLAFCTILIISRADSASNYFGKSIGPLKSYHHALGGDVYLVDSRTIHIKNFNYDGEGPAGYFYVSNTKTPNENGIKLRDERGSTAPLKRYRKKHITLTLPEGKSINNIKWFYVWCDEFAVNFGDVKIPKNMDFPKPQKIGKLNGVHSVSSDNIVVVDAQTLLIPSFSYDGEAPDAKFWVGSGSKPSPQGIRVPDENGKEEPLRKYDKKTIVLTLPGDLTVFEIGHFGIWCEAFTVDFGHIQIPKDLNIPPSLKMLGVSPQSKLNCEILYDDLAFEVRWAVAGDSIVIQLVAKLEKGEYMSFGISGEIDRNTMIGGDVVVAWIDHETLNGYAYDYFLDAKSQCAGTHGSCPDIKLRSTTESIRLLNAALVNGYSIVTYQRPLRAHDEFDLPIYTNGSQAIIWAIGPLNSLQEVSYHSITSKITTLIDFGRPPQWNCPIPESDATISESENNDNYNEAHTFANNEQIQTETSVKSRVSELKEQEITKPTTKRVEATPAPVKKEKPWDIPPIQCNEPDDGVFYAQMGPAGGKRGYPAITGHVGWGIAWYINGLLIPEINVVRGRTYNFIVEGGMDPEVPAKYHPLYITDDPVGGFYYKTPEEKAKIKIFAGVTQSKDGEYIPTVGRSCYWTPDQSQPQADEFASFGAYQRTLSLVCDHGAPGVVQWTPDENTPDTVYYQCFTHRYLGWKINVLDTCDKDEAESEQITSRIRIDSDADIGDEPIFNPSIQVVTRVKASNSSLYNDIPTINGVKNNNILTPQMKDSMKNEYSPSERIILQDPYMPPPPYQKNFDYQSMQSTEPMKEVKPITEKLEYDFPINQEPQIRNHPYFLNNTTPQSIYLSSPAVYKYNKNYPYKDVYASASNHKTPVYTTGPSKYQIPPAMHIHVIKHAEPKEEILPGFSKPYPVGRPYRHSVVIKKPIHKMKSSYSHMRVNKIPKQTEQQVASSNPVKAVLPPSITNVIPKIPPNIPPSFAYLPMSKKPHVPHVSNRKKEETIKTQFIMNKIEENPNTYTHAQGGFNPSSIVIESGFKPIIPNAENQNVAQDRMSEDVEDYVEQDPPKDFVNENETISDDHSKNPFEGKEPELFEPIFIPSPLINELHRKKKPIPEQGLKVKLHKPGQSNIVYIWPNEEESNVPLKQPSYYNYYTVDTISAPVYKGYENEQPPITSENGVDGAGYQLNNEQIPSVAHTYKVNEYFDVHAEVSDANNSTEKNLQIQTESENKVNPLSKHKIKYIPVSYNSDNENSENEKFIISIPDGQSTESSNNTIKS